MVKLGSLFTGYSGLDMAVEQVFGARTVWTSDIDPGACKIIAHRMPDLPNLGDITAIDWAAVEPVDILTGGFPCQDVSFAGKRAGLRPGTRTGLWGEFLRCIVELRPQHVVVENVLGLMSGEWTDEPNDRCLCGWAYRRGGMHWDPDEDEQVGDGLLGGGFGGDDRQGQVSPHRLEERVRGLRGAAPRADRAVGVGLEVGDPWRGGGAVSVLDQGPLAPQGGAGPDRPAGRGDQVSAAGEEERQRLLDGAGALPLRVIDEAAARVERQGSGDDTHAGLLCPACGRDLGDGSTRNVFRSGISVVLGDLASVGYVCRWRCLRAADVGAPHGRARIFILATDTHGEAGRWDEPWGVTPSQAQGTLPETGWGVRRGRGPSATDAQRGGWDGRAGELGPGRRAEPADSSGPAADTDRPGSQGPVATVAAGRAGIAGRAAADSTGDGWHQGWPEPAGLVGRPDAAQRGDAVTDTDSDGQQGVGRLEPVRRDPDRRSGADRAWGPYEPAIRRWERTLGRPAPAPTETSPRGTQRLSPAFVEWMQGLEPGWVTAVPGLSRNAQLKALGNGVVPQQAAAALRLMLNQLTAVA